MQGVSFVGPRGALGLSLLQGVSVQGRRVSVLGRFGGCHPVEAAGDEAKDVVG